MSFISFSIAYKPTYMYKNMYYKLYKNIFLIPDFTGSVV